MDETQPKKTGRGGKRDGAGRKPTNHGRYIGFNSSPETERILDGLHGTSKTAFINAAIAAYTRNRSQYENHNP